MRSSLKCLSFYFIINTTLLNLYLFSQLYVEQEKSNKNIVNKQQYFGIFNNIINKKQQLFYKQKSNNEFLVLDWTAKHHMFKEQDPINCNFSHINLDYCQSKFHSIVNNTLRLHLIERCTRLSQLIIRWTYDQSYLKQADLIAYHSIHMPRNDLPILIRNNQQQQFSMVYILESEVHSLNGEYWHKIDFPMWYNLERSYPEPATYFNLHTYLNQLFAPIKIPFSKKITTAPIVWIITNCHAYNGRQVFIQELMSYIRIDSYGKCLNNIKSNHITTHKQSNSILYSSYKFVIAIENSNCEDYVTEKLIDVLSSTSIPIVASRNRKPDYTRFAPKYSYINVYDYKSIKDLANYLNYLSTNETAYNEYLWFRKLSINKHTSSVTTKRTLTENLHLADEILGVNATMRKWLLNKETSMNKYCKLVQFIYTNYWKSIYKRKKIDRPTANEVCLPRNDLVSYFLLTRS
ncbi:unnamed protein product [Rotaria sordida]|uniref:Fucosyltransferase n=2 Tax=Rotaria sordida TaxID=392033 RepID=A0A819B9Z6_9BILA|nr:unnamed protein product [Rotaria sordida]CAF3793328.1 unnamed protein product [Rotaria sordida]